MLILGLLGALKILDYTPDCLASETSMRALQMLR